MSLSSELNEQLALVNIKPERFREILVRLMSYGVIVREEDRVEQQFYDDARRVEPLLEDYFDISGFRLHHDATNMFYRLYAAGAVVDGLPEDTLEPTPSLRARVSADFVAMALTLRFLYQSKLNSGDIQPQGEALVSFEEIALTMQTQLKRQLPNGVADKMALLADLRRHRLLTFNTQFSLSDEDALLAIRPTILGVVSNDSMGAALESDGVMEQVVGADEVPEPLEGDNNEA